MGDKKLTQIQSGDDASFYEQIAELLAVSRKYAKQQLDSTITVTYFEVGRMIVEREQQGEKRAKYGAKLLKGLSEHLTEKYGRGFSVENLQNIRKFYYAYAPSIQQTLSTKSDPNEKQQTLSTKFQINQTLSALFNLSWSHYQILMRVKNENARRFYEIETVSQQWSVRQLQRQVGSSLYERLALSREKNTVMALSNEGQTIEKPEDIFKSPYIFEFTGLEEQSHYSETDLEKALIDNMQKFLLEIGKGFLYEARQKRFTFDEDSFYLDLVLYNRLLQCYVIIDLKIGKLKHQDLGQMQMYVNYFDRYVKQDCEKPTIGILICENKKDKIVELTLPKNSNIYASEYSLYLPEKSLLQSKVAEWVKEFEYEQEIRKLVKNDD